MWLSCSCALLLLAPAADDKKPAVYPRADLLIEAAELAKPEVAKGFRIVDVRPRSNYDAGHIPDALWLDLTKLAASATAEKEDPSWRDMLLKKGLAPKVRVVIYDDGGAREAARAWWVLRYCGFDDVRLLNGGWAAWQAGGGKVSKDEPSIPPADGKHFKQDGRLATKDHILKGLKEKPAQLIDARSKEEHCGERQTAKRNGAMPGAVHLEWTDTLDPKTKRFKTADELNKLFEDAGIDLHKPAVTYCQSGGRAAVMAFALELMGAKDVRNYYKSWAEWGNADDTPVEKPKK